MITVELLQKICPKTKRQVLETYAGTLNDVAQYYDMYDNP